MERKESGKTLGKRKGGGGGGGVGEEYKGINKKFQKKLLVCSVHEEHLRR